MWRDLRAQCKDHRRINFGLAANIVGFAKFPVGWSWTECQLKRNTWRPEAFAKAETLSLLDIRSDGKSTRDGMRAFRRGGTFRRKAAEHELCQLILAQEIPAWLTNRHGDTGEISDTVRLHHGLFVDGKRSSVGFEDFDWHGETDALRLIDAITEQCAWKTKASNHDWLFIERLAREKIEALGLPAEQSDLHNQVLAELTSQRPNACEPPRSGVLERLAGLLREYRESEN